MLIMPLHRRMTRANFPVVTFALIALNVCVFVFLQWGDTAITHRATQYYAQARLGRVEFPAYIDWLDGHDGSAEQQTIMRRAPLPVKLALIQSDSAFLAALHAGRVIKPSNPAYARWHTDRAHFEHIRAQAFTPQHAMRFTQVEPVRMLWAMFMHGGVMHLFGNMLFLVVLGLLVEGALNWGWFIGLYLAGGYAAAFASLALHWGEPGLGLGASGAIASLMGAFCVIWGLRKVRVFYWFFVVFDYVRVPALWLLPVWFGWQLYQLFFEAGAHIAFGAHAAGIAAGAFMGLALRRTGQVRQDFLEQDDREEQRDSHESAYAEAMTHLGRLELDQARRLLQAIEAEEPGQLRILVALYRCARYGGRAAQMDAAAVRVLTLPATTRAEVDEYVTLWEDYLKACSGVPRLNPESLLRQVSGWLRLGRVDAVQAVLHSLDKLATPPPALAAAWFTLAMHAPEASAERQARLDHLARHFPHSRYAAKARFLLEQGSAIE